MLIHIIAGISSIFMDGMYPWLSTAGDLKSYAGLCDTDMYVYIQQYG